MKKSTKLRAGGNPPMFLVSLHSQHATWTDSYLSTSGDWFFFSLPDAHPTIKMNKLILRLNFRSFKQGNRTHSYLYVHVNPRIPNSQFPILDSQFSNFPLLPQTSRGGVGGGGFANTFSLARLVDVQVRGFLRLISTVIDECH